MGRKKKAWDAIVLGRGEFCKSSPSAAVERQYSSARQMSSCRCDFLLPKRAAGARWRSVLFFNFRAESGEALSQAFLLKDFDGLDREVWPQVHFVSLTQYDVRFPSPFLFPQQELAVSWLRS